MKLLRLFIAGVPRLVAESRLVPAESPLSGLVDADNPNVEQQGLVDVAGVAEDEVERSVTRKGGGLGSHRIVAAIALGIAQLRCKKIRETGRSARLGSFSSYIRRFVSRREKGGAEPQSQSR